jgi:hypothetical protein
MPTVSVKVADLPEVKAAFAALISHADSQAKTIEALAFEVWSGTQRCVFCPRGYCERCRSAIALLDSLGFGERMREWAG